MSNTKMDERKRPLLWNRVLGLLKQDRAERRSMKLFVEAPGEFGPYQQQKEIGELSALERRSLPPALGKHVLERLLDRYLAEQGCVDLVERRRPYAKKIDVLTSEDLPALVEADWLSVGEEYRKERERAVFAGDARADLNRLRVPELAGMSEAGKEARR